MAGLVNALSGELRKNQGGPFIRHASGRAIRQNIYGNTVWYLGKRRLHDFGNAHGDAMEWLENGDWLGIAPDCSGRDAVYSLTSTGELLHRIVPNI